jgi:hypothetical protein
VIVCVMVPHPDIPSRDSTRYGVVSSRRVRAREIRSDRRVEVASMTPSVAGQTPTSDMHWPPARPQAAVPRSARDEQEVSVGRVIHNPISGERIVVRASGTQTDGRLFAFDLFLPPGGHVPARAMSIQSSRNVLPWLRV